jgi:long-chain fatty acid transport protein
MAYHPDLGGPRSDQENQTFFLPHLYVTHPLKRQLTLGLGVFVPFGLATDWPVDWEGRFQVTFASVRATMIRPTIAWRLLRWLSVAGGPDLARVSIEQRRQINLSRVGEDAGIGPIAGNPEGSVSLEGDAQALGYHVSALIEPSEQWRAGINFRSRLRAEVNDGQAKFQIPVPAFQPAFPDGTARTEVDLPPALGIGVLVRPKPAWNVELDANWTGWSTIDKFVVQFDQGLPVSSETTDFSWKNSFSYGFGTEYRWPQYVIRTVAPVIAEGNRQYFTFGGGIVRAKWDFNVGYQLLLFERAKHNSMGSNYSSSGAPPAIPAINAEADGLYETYSHTLVLSLTTRF